MCRPAPPIRWLPVVSLPNLVVVATTKAAIGGFDSIVLSRKTNRYSFVHSSCGRNVRSPTFPCGRPLPLATRSDEGSKPHRVRCRQRSLAPCAPSTVSGIEIGPTSPVQQCLVYSFLFRRSDDFVSYNECFFSLPVGPR